MTQEAIVLIFYLVSYSYENPHEPSIHTYFNEFKKCAETAEDISILRPTRTFRCVAARSRILKTLISLDEQNEGKKSEDGKSEDELHEIARRKEELSREVRMLELKREVRELEEKRAQLREEIRALEEKVRKGANDGRREPEDRSGPAASTE